MSGSRSDAWDAIVVGGGVIGSSVAYHLVTAEPTLRVVVVERDPTYTRASSALSVGNVRVQFSLRENLLASLHALEVFARFGDEMEVDGVAPDIRLRPEGNLFLVPEEERNAATRALAAQVAAGGEVEWWPPAEITRRHPLYRPDGLAGGTFGPRDGHLDGYALLAAYRAKARSLGATYLEAEVSAVDVEEGTARGVTLSSGEHLVGGAVVCCAGAWASEVLRTAGVELPVVPVSRQVFVVEAERPFDGPLPLTVLPSGLYFRSEGEGRLLVGRSLPEDPVGVHFAWRESRFFDHLWPELAAFAPVFDRLRLLRGWAGLYAVNTVDGNAVLGEWPEVGRLFLANGFSGHGLQQAPAAGRYLAEQILGRTPTLDLAALGPERIIAGHPLGERGLV